MNECTTVICYYSVFPHIFYHLYFICHYLYLHNVDGNLGLYHKILHNGHTFYSTDRFPEGVFTK